MMVFYPMPMAISYHHSLYCQAVRVVLCTGNWPPLQAGAECGLGQINSSSVKTGELGVTSYRGQQGAVHPLAHPCLGSGARPGDGVVSGVGAVTRLPQPFLFLTAAVSLVAAARQATPAQAAQPAQSPHPGCCQGAVLTESDLSGAGGP